MLEYNGTYFRDKNNSDEWEKYWVKHMSAIIVKRGLGILVWVGRQS